MRILQPLIARLVDDVLRLIREAAMEDLKNLVVSDGRRSPEPRPVERTSGTRRAASVSIRRPALQESPKQSLEAAKTLDLAPLPTVAEITDPEALLAGAVPAPVPPPVFGPARVTEAEGDGPPSAVRPLPIVSPVRLMGNETLARVSGSGVVIRRGRRA
jgi:hypothetical protein